MRKKIISTICVFSCFLIAVSVAIVNVLAATRASVTVTASVSYTPAIMAKIYVSLDDSQTEYLIFNNYNNDSLDTTLINTPTNFTQIQFKNSQVSGTSYTFRVENYSGKAIQAGVLVTATASITQNEQSSEVSILLPDSPEDGIETYVSGLITTVTVDSQAINATQAIEDQSTTTEFTVCPQVIVSGSVNFQIFLVEVSVN